MLLAAEVFNRRGALLCGLSRVIQVGPSHPMCTWGICWRAQRGVRVPCLCRGAEHGVQRGLSPQQALWKFSCLYLPASSEMETQHSSICHKETSDVASHRPLCQLRDVNLDSLSCPASDSQACTQAELLFIFI